MIVVLQQKQILCVVAKTDTIEIRICHRNWFKSVKCKLHLQCAILLKNKNTSFSSLLKRYIHDICTFNTKKHSELKETHILVTKNAPLFEPKSTNLITLNDEIPQTSYLLE